MINAQFAGEEPDGFRLVEDGISTTPPNEIRLGRDPVLAVPGDSPIRKRNASEVDGGVLSVRTPLKRALRYAGEEDEMESEFKAKYRKAKKNFMAAVETHEYLERELRSYQRELQLLQEDKFFLCERLLLYEKPGESPPESPDNSDSDSEAPTTSGAKKCRGGSAAATSGGVTFSSAFSKMKPFASGRKAKRTTKAKLTEEMFFESPSESLGPAEEENVDSTSSPSFHLQQNPDDSE